MTSGIAASLPRTSARLLVTLGLLAATPGAAGSQRAAPRCSVEISGLRFGAYDVFQAAPLDAVGTMTLECSGLQQGAQITISLGRGNERESLKRALRHKRHSLSYQVYLDAARSLVWGDGTGGTSVYRTRPAANVPISIPVFGRIPPLQMVAPGEYSDHLMLIVDY
jgi:spore coat protein U-like protein